MKGSTIMEELEALRDLIGEEVTEQGLPPGFRFHPTDEELVTFYLSSKVFNGSVEFCAVDIVEVDLNRCEPWELPEVAKIGEKEWYFFSLRDRKYTTGLRTNRATGAGYWKATGKDREVHSAATGALVGMKKTLVFYKGRAPRGQKTKWVLHEYRLHGYYSLRHTSKEEWVMCRIFHKTATYKKNSQYYCPCSTFLMDPFSSPNPCIDINPLLYVDQSHGLLPPFNFPREVDSLFPLPSTAILNIPIREMQPLKFPLPSTAILNIPVQETTEHYLRNSNLLVSDMGLGELFNLT